MRGLPYILVESPTKVQFNDDKTATVTTYLKDRKTSRFDFILGFLPNNTLADRFIVTGQLQLDLINPFGTGKELFLEWTRPQLRSQKLESRFVYPYIAGLPLGAQASLFIDKRDTLFLNLDWSVGINYALSGRLQFRADVYRQSTNLLEIDTGAIVSSGDLPAQLDMNKTILDLSLTHRKVDDPRVPRSGWNIQASIGAGAKKIKNNDEIDAIVDEGIQSAYDSVVGKSIQYQFGFSIERFTRIGKISSLKTGLYTKGIFSDNIFDNEDFRLGGGRLLRGFDDESILTPYYALFLVEYRLFIAEASFLFAFTDWAIVSDDRPGETVDVPVGFGAGLALDTKAGIFKVTYALGTRLDNKVQFRSSKIHFGYVNQF